MQKSQLGEAFIPIRAMLDMLDKDLDTARGKVNSNLDKITKNLSVVGAGALSGIGVATGAVTALGIALGKITWDSAPMEGIQNAFYGIADASSIGGDAMLKALQDGSQAMISNRDLMMSFNKAAQLVGQDFAVQLPDAMNYLTKVASATGQDMNYMMDSLVVGVGRLSPMILDNLGIQVKLSDATERASEMYGVQAEELTKAQQQAGMMSVVLEKLKANTDAMPDTTMNATTAIAQFKTLMQNTKDNLGTAFLPILKSVLKSFSTFAANVLPRVQQGLDKLRPIIDKVALFIDKVSTALLDAGIGSTEFREALTILIPKEVVDKVYEIAEGIGEFLAKVQEILAPVADFITQNVKLQDVLIAVGLAILTFVLPAIWSVVASMAPIIGTFLLVIGAIALLRTAWENDFLGIRTSATQLWDEKLAPMFAVLKEWLAVNIPIALDYLKNMWETVLLPAIQTVWTWISTVLWPGFMGFGEWLLGVFSGAITFISELWTGTLQPAFEAVWNWASTILFPFFEALGEFFSATFSVAITALAGLWQNVLQPALEDVWTFLDANLMPIIEDLVKWFDEKIAPALKKVGDSMGGKMKTAFEGISKAIEAVTGWLKKMSDKLSNLSLPDWLTPGSPTPWEIGLVGISKAMRKLNSSDLPALHAQLDFDTTDTIFGVGGENTQSVSKGVTIENMNNYISSGVDTVQYSINRAMAKAGSL